MRVKKEIHYLYEASEEIGMLDLCRVGKYRYLYSSRRVKSVWSNC
ncbi:unnamed protein product, partial [marine sediment metagenome]